MAWYKHIWVSSEQRRMQGTDLTVETKMAQVHRHSASAAKSVTDRSVCSCCNLQGGLKICWTRPKNWDFWLYWLKQKMFVGFSWNSLKQNITISKSFVFLFANKYKTIFAKHLAHFCTSYNFIKYWRIFENFHCQNQEKICNNIITKDPTTPEMCRYTTLWNVNVLKQQLKTRLL